MLRASTPVATTSERLPARAPRSDHQDEQTQLASSRELTNFATTPLGNLRLVRRAQVQRACACGGTPGSDGLCDGCRRKLLAGKGSVADLRPRRGAHLVHGGGLRCSSAQALVPARGGQALPSSTRLPLEARLGHDFSHVNVHTGSEAAAAAAKVEARAFTLGRDIVFGTGQYSPNSMTGRRLLAHELVHVVQQTGAAMPSGAEPVAISSPQDPAEREAEGVADRVVRGQTSNDVLSLPRGARAHVQRACGPALGQPRTPCEPGGAPVAGQHFAFVVNCDDPQPGEATSIVAFARALAPGTRLRVHGYASEEGPASFNHVLSCARANLVAERLRAARPDCRVVAVIEHGAQTSPAGRAHWRAASVEEIPPQAVAPVAAEDCGRLVGSCEFYRCRQRRARTGFPPTGYYLGYGLKYCERFSTRTRPRLSPAGQRWLDKTLPCLQAWIHSHLSYDADPDTVKRGAFGSHPDCYVLSGLCFLSPHDWHEIWDTIDSADNDLAQVLRTAVFCGGNIGALVIPGSLAAGGGLHGQMERDWQRNFGQRGGPATPVRPFPPSAR